MEEPQVDGPSEPIIEDRKSDSQPPARMLENKLSATQMEEIWDGRRRIAWVALIAMIIPTLYIIGWVVDVNLMNTMGDLMSWFYLAMASIVCAYFGFSSWANIKGK